MIADHIFVYFECFALGGVERSALRHMREWVAAGRRVTLFVGANEGPLTAELPDGVELIVGKVHSYIGMFRPVIAAVRRLKPDAIFVPGNRYTSIAMATSLVLGRGCPPMVVKISNSFVRADYAPMKAWSYRLFVRAKPKFFAHFVALSAAMRDEAIEVARFPALQVSVIADPVISSLVVALKESGPPRLVTVGRMVEQKRLDLLIRAFARIPASLDARLDLVGDGPEQDNVEAAIAECGVGKRVTLHGYLADPAPIIARAQALVLSSAYEGLPAVIPEAFAAGTPVVTTASSSSLPALIDDPRLGTIVPLDDVDALAAAMAERLAGEPARGWIKARSLGAGWPKAATAYLAVFDAAVTARADRRGPVTAHPSTATSQLPLSAG